MFDYCLPCLQCWKYQPKYPTSYWNMLSFLFQSTCNFGWSCTKKECEEVCVCVRVHCCELTRGLALSDSRRMGIYFDSVVVSPSVCDQLPVYVCAAAVRLPANRWPPAPRLQCWEGREALRLAQFAKKIHSATAADFQIILVQHFKNDRVEWPLCVT